MNTIDVRKLKEAIDLLFDHIIDSGVERLDIETQYYWQAEEHREYGFFSDSRKGLRSAIFMRTWRRWGRCCRTRNTCSRTR